MERIDLTGSSPNLKNDKGKKVGRKSGNFISGIFNTSQAAEANTTETDFSFYLSSVYDENISLETLLDDVHSSGEKLVEKPFISNVKEYKQAVRRFLAYVVKNTFSAETEIEKKKYIKNGLPFVDEKKWTNIKIVDEKLEKLALYIIQNQRGQLTILKKIEEIEGILVDLMR